jgi:hypothetical protein
MFLSRVQQDDEQPWALKETIVKASHLPGEVLVTFPAFQQLDVHA